MFFIFFIFKVSAKTGDGISELLKLVAQKVLEQPRSGGGTGRGNSSMRYDEKLPLLTESCDRDGFVTTKDVDKDQCCCGGCVLL